MDKVAGIVVLYYPDFEKLDRLYNSVINQVDLLFFIDNTDNKEFVKMNEKKIIEYKGNLGEEIVFYESLGVNMGIATAQNLGINYAKKNNIKYILLLDQDSSLPKNMISKLVFSYNELKQHYERVAVVGPIFIDEKTKEMAKLIQHKGLRVLKNTPNTNNSFEISDYLIASGSLIDIEVFDKLGLMKECLFIDWVDIEWGLRAKQLGYLSFAIPGVIMKHSIGDESVKFVDKNINLHSDFRNYFIVRNSLYLALYSKLPMNFRIIQLFKTPLYILFYSYHSKKPFYSLKLLLIAVKDAILKKMGKGYFEEKEV